MGIEGLVNAAVAGEDGVADCCVDAVSVPAQPTSTTVDAATETRRLRMQPTVATPARLGPARWWDVTAR
jgi:hypothetical protein